MIILIKKITYLRMKEVNQKEKVDSFVIPPLPSFFCFVVLLLVLLVQGSFREAEECIGEGPREEFQGSSLAPVQLC